MRRMAHLMSCCCCCSSFMMLRSCSALAAAPRRPLADVLSGTLPEAGGRLRFCCMCSTCVCADSQASGCQPAMQAAPVMPEGATQQRKPLLQSCSGSCPPGSMSSKRGVGSMQRMAGMSLGCTPPAWCAAPIACGSAPPAATARSEQPAALPHSLCAPSPPPARREGYAALVMCSASSIRAATLHSCGTCKRQAMLPSLQS